MCFCSYMYLSVGKIGEEWCHDIVGVFQLKNNAIDEYDRVCDRVSELVS